MKYLSLGSAKQMPAVGLGTWKLTDENTYDTIRKAIRIGYRHFDCAARYENEKHIGMALQDAMQSGEVTREELWITSKLWNNAHLPADVAPALEETLSDLKLNYLDLYLMHWPVALKPDVIFPSSGADFLSESEAPIADAFAAMEQLVSQQKTVHIGVSNFTIAKLKELAKTTQLPIACNQVESHPFLTQEPLFEYCKSNRIILTAYSPLGSQDRPARLIRENEPSLLEHPTILEIAKTYGVSPGQVLISWAVNRGTAVIPKSSNPDRLMQNLQAGDLTLAQDTLNQISALNKDFRFVDGTFWAPEGSPYTVDWLWND